MIGVVMTAKNAPLMCKTEFVVIFADMNGIAYGDTLEALLENLKFKNQREF